MTKKRKRKKKSSGLSNILVTIIMILCFGVVVFSGWKLWGYYSGYKTAENEYENLRRYMDEDKEAEEADEPEDGTKRAPKDRCPIKVDFDALKKINSDVVGWIYIEGSGINYPIVQSREGDNEYYLHKTFEGQSNFSGAIFMDVACDSSFLSDNSIIYGHNLKSGKMFGYLKSMYDTEYNEKADYKKYPNIWILTPTKICEYKVFAGREISAVKDVDVYMVEFGTFADFTEYLENMKAMSLFKTDIKPESYDRIVTLSTCTSDSEDGRFIVQGTMIQEIDTNQ